MPKSVTFVCTPEIVTSWLFYPAWFCNSKYFPNKIVLDYKEYDYYDREYHSLEATPYEYIVYDTFREYIENQFLVVHEKAPSGERIPINYNLKVGKYKLKQIGKEALKILNSVNQSKEQLQAIVLKGYDSWLKFGLILKKQFKTKDPIYPEAIKRTEEELTQILRGNYGKLNPEKLVLRYLTKLLTGYEIAVQYENMYGKAVVFDTPEYRPTADILERFGYDMDKFAIPDSDMNPNQRFIYEVLKIDKPDEPVAQSNFLKLLEAVEYIQGSTNDVKTETNEELNKVKRKINDITSIFQVKYAGISTAIMTALARGFDSSELAGAGFGMFLGLVLSKIVGETLVDSGLEGCTKATKYIVQQEIFKKGRYRNIRKTVMNTLIKLARTLTIRKKTTERIARQMKQPWLESSVWYDLS